MAAVRLKYLFAIFLYGTIGFFLRYVTVPTEIVVFFRAFIGFLTLLVIMRIRHVQLNRQGIKEHFKYLVLSGICLGFNWVFLFAAYMHTTVAIASLCNYMAPIIVIIVAPFLLSESINIRKIGCVIVALTGMVFLSGILSGTDQHANPVGIALGRGAACCFVGLVIFNRKVRGVSFYDRSVVQLATSAVIVLIYAVAVNLGKEIHVDLRSVLIILMLGILHTGIAYCYYFDGMARLPLTTYAVLGYFEPVVSVLCSVFLLHEKMTMGGLCGTVMIIAAALMSELLTNAQGPSAGEEAV